MRFTAGLTGQTALITGANSGIGFEAARLLAQAGANVVLACRNAERGGLAAARINEECGHRRAELLLLDLASLSSIRQAVRQAADRYDRIDIICNNAGLMAIPYALTTDGFEMQIGVNHFGHFALVGGLLDSAPRSLPARVVTVSSTMHWVGAFRFEDLDSRKGYHPWLAYARSKLANLIFANELARRARASGLSLQSLACHPGYASTNLQQVGPMLTGARAHAAIFRLGNALFAQSAARGALPIVVAATDPSLQAGDYIGPGSLGGLRGEPEHARSSAAARDPELARRLWEISVERTGVEYRVLQRSAPVATPASSSAGS